VIIQASASIDALLQRLRERAARIAAAALVGQRRRAPDWHSASALWPDLFREDRHGE